MNELVARTPEQPQEQTSDTAEQSTPIETGLVRVEQEKILEKSDIDELQRKASELGGIYDVQRGLEGSIIGAGLQVMVDRYGADIFLDAMQGYDKERGRASTIQDVIQRLAPDKNQQKALYGAIKAEPMDALADRFNHTLGGVTNGSAQVSAMERFRRFQMFNVENRRVMKDVDGNRVHRARDTGGVTDSANLLITGYLDSLLGDNPELVENFRESNDTLILLKGIRDIYETKYAEFITDLEKAKAAVEEKIAKEELSVAELKTITDEILSEEIASIEKRLAAAGSDAVKDMLRDMLEKKATEVTAVREEYRIKMEAVRSQIVANLGADKLHQLRVAAPGKAEPIDNDKEQPSAA